MPGCLTLTDLSHALSTQDATNHRLTVNTIRKVPGQIVMRVLITNLVLKLILFSAPILREEASVNSLLCRSITRPVR